MSCSSQGRVTASYILQQHPIIILPTAKSNSCVLFDLDVSLYVSPSSTPKKNKSGLEKPSLRDVLKGLLSSVFMKAWESILPKSFIKTAFHILQTCVCVCVGGGRLNVLISFPLSQSLKVDLDKSVSQMPKCNINVFFFSFSKKDLKKKNIYRRALHI